MRSKTVALSLLILLVCAMLPTILFVNGQVNAGAEENLVNLAEQTGNQIQNVITAVYADENATARIENASLTNQFEGNVTLYQQDGLGKLAAAKEALANSNHELAANSALQALSTFRNVYSSLQSILDAAGLQDNAAINNQELMDAINREIQRIDTLQNLFAANATQEIKALFEKTKTTLLEAKTALLEGKYDQAQALYVEAKQNTNQIYQYIKTQAEESDGWRLSGYCQMMQQRIQDSFRYGSDHGIDYSAALQKLGYQSENQFMQELQNKIQKAKSQSDIKNAIEECLTINQMVQQMQQGLNEENNRQQAPNPTGSGATTGPSNGVGGGDTVGGNSTSNGGSNAGYNGTSGKGGK